MMKRADIQGLSETIIVMIGVLAICYTFNPADPLLVHSPFPWIWLLTAALSLRHGRISAATSSIIIVGVIMHTIHSSLYSWDSYRLWFLGGLTLNVICAEYEAWWHKRQFSLNKRENYLNVRLNSLSQAYGVLRLSHDRLEESLVMRPGTLREALASLRQALIIHKGQMTPTIALQYLEILANHANIDVCALYLYEKKQWQQTPIAFIGKDEPLNENNILVKKMMQNRKANFIAINMIQEEENEYLAVLPMQTADNKLLGILVIKDIPFIALNEETLKKLSLLLAYIADDAWSAQQAIHLHEQYPDCPSLFATEIYKLHQLWKIAKVNSTVVVYHIKPSQQQADIVFFLEEKREMLDLVWQHQKGEVVILITLLPLTEHAMFEGYCERIGRQLKEMFNVELGQDPVLLEQRELSSYTDVKNLLAEVLDYEK